MRFVLFAVGLSLASSAVAQEAFVPHQGRLLDTLGVPIEGEHTVRVTLYSDAEGTVDEWRKSYTNVNFSSGYYSVVLEGDDDAVSARSLDTALGSALWFGLSIDGGSDLGAPQRVSTLLGRSTLGTASNPATSCRAIQRAGAAQGDGDYVLNPASPTTTYCNMSSRNPDYKLITPDRFYHADNINTGQTGGGPGAFHYYCDACSAALRWYDMPCPDENWEVHFYGMRTHCDHTTHVGTSDTVFDMTLATYDGVPGARVRQTTDSCGDPNEFTAVVVCKVSGTTEPDPGGWDRHFRDVTWNN